MDGSTRGYGAALPVHAVRAGLTLTSALLHALATELWLRLAVVPRYRPGTDAWHRAWSREVARWGSGTARLTMKLARIRLDVRGTAPVSGRYVVVANHQSSVDIPFLIHVLRPLDLKFVAFERLRRFKPAVSLGLRMGGSVFIGKSDPREDIRNLRRFAGSLAENGGSAVIFPEGIRTHDGILQPFQFAGTRIVREVSGLPVLPVVHDGLWRARTVAGAHRMIGTTIRFRILDPVPAERFGERGRDAYGELEASIRAALAEMRGESG